MKKNKETKKLKEGDELIYSDGKTLMEKVTVESIDKKAGFAILSNKVKVARTLGPLGTYPRLDAKTTQVIRPLTEESELEYNAFKAYFSIKRNMELMDSKIRNLKDSTMFELMVDFDRKLNKLVTKYFKEEQA